MYEASIYFIIAYCIVTLWITFLNPKIHFLIIAIFICRLTKEVVVLLEHLVDGTQKLVIVKKALVPSMIYMATTTKNVVKILMKLVVYTKFFIDITITSVGITINFENRT